jgi:hypothetical protein
LFKGLLFDELLFDEPLFDEPLFDEPLFDEPLFEALILTRDRRSVDGRPTGPNRGPGWC